MKRLPYFCALACCLTFSACEDADFAGMLSFTDARVNERFDASMNLLVANPVADVNAASDEYAIYLVTDMHCDGSDDRLDRFVSACVGDAVTEKVVLCLGDIVNGKNHHSQVHSKLQPLADAGWRFLNALGNHDIYFNQFDLFSHYWPLTTYTFQMNLPDGHSDLFICLDTAEGSCGTSQRAWLEKQLKASAGQHRNIYVYTHTNFFNTDNTQVTSGNLSLEETYDLMSLFALHGVTSVLTGHDHHFEHCVFRGVSYYSFNALCNDVGSYYRLTFSKEGLQFEEITLK